MNLHETNLKKIIRVIEEYGAVLDVQICNNSIVICHPSSTSKPKPAKVTEIDLNRAKDFIIKFKLGDMKSEKN